MPAVPRILTLVLAVAAGVGSAPAAVVHVNGSVSGGLNNGTSWGNAYSSLQTAITNAVSGDEIRVAAGTYKPTSTTDRTAAFTLKNGVGIYGGFAGTEANRNDRSVAGNVTILSGEIGATGRADNSYHVVNDGGTNATAILDGFTITAGNANGSGNDQQGSALWSTGSPTIANCTFTENFAAFSVVLISPGSPALANCTFSRNVSAQSFVIAMGGGAPAFESCTFDRNTGPYGAIQSGNASPAFTNCRFTNNTATTYTSGAMYLNGGTVTIRNAVFSGNTAAQQAGAVFTQNGTVTITNALFAGNKAAWGAAVWAGSSSNVTLTNCTITNNTATNSGIVAMDVSTLTIRNSILWNNSGTLAFNGSPTITYSDVQGSYSGTGNINSDPLFLNGGNPGDLRLSASSPAIDAADNTAVPGGVTTDLAGAARFFDDPSTSDTGVGPAPIVDMGAYEFPAAISGVNLSVATGGEGTGHIGSTPVGLDCGATCSANFTAGTMVTLTPTPDSGMVFTGWSGGCSGTGSCIVTLNAATSVIASFAPLRFVDAQATGNGSGLTWANASTSLATTLADAVSGTEIWVKAGTHTPGSLRSSTFAITNGVKLYGGFAGTETSRSQRDPAGNRTILSGEIGASGTSDNSYHVVTTDASTTASTIVDGFVITGGNADGSGFDLHGAGILANGSPEIRNCLIAGNAAHATSGVGGGIFFATSGATPRVVNTSFVGNSAYYGAAAYVNGILTMINCSVTANRASSYTFFFGTPTSTVTNTIVWNNAGGTINGNATVTYSIIEGGYTGTGNLNADPLFVDPGGRNLHLQSDSPAIDAGNDAAVPSTITTDADLFSRFAGVVDVGAYEHATDRLTVTKFGDGTGSVTGGAINCGSTCSATLATNTEVTLTATADPGWKFTGWGGPCIGTGTCTVRVPAHVTARFGKVYYVNWAAPGANDGTNWTNAFTALQSAITAATGLADDIWVAAGTYKPTTGSDRSATFTLESGAGIYGGFAATETDRSQRNVAANVTTLSGEIGTAAATDNSYHVITSTTADASAVVDGFTIAGGYADNFSGNGFRGGGIVIENSWPRIENCTISGNHAYRGGGISALSSGSPTIADCVITANTAVQYGGGVELYNSYAQIIDSEIHTNSASQNGGNGGGVYIEGGKPRIRGCEVRSNTIAMNGWGAGIRAYSTNAQILDSTIRDNDAGSNSSAGGGIHVEVNASWLPSVANCRITGNTANVSAGVHFLGTFTMTNCTVANNTAATTGGGASVVSYSPTIANSIFWGNSPNQIYNAGSPTVTYSDVQGGFAGTGNIDADPLFVNAAGGNFRLASTSPAVDAGSNNASSSLSTDIEGKPRRIDAPRVDTGLGSAPIVDMGAYEFHPVTVSAPANTNACIGGTASFSVTASGWGTLTYQWRKNETPVGPNASTYTIDPVAADSGGSYDVIVTDSIGTTTTSSAATMTVSAPPSISMDPSGQTICSGSTATFTVSATGPGLTYQWRRNGDPIDGATGATYQVVGATPANNGTYDVVVSGTCAPSATSDPATLVVNTPPQVSQSPSNVTVCAGQEASFQVTASGANLTYQWRRNGDPIDGATGATYTIQSTTTANAGSYDVVVSGACSPPATSNAATLVVNTTATIDSHPQNVTVCRNQPVQFSVGVTGAGLTYQWRRNTVPIENENGTTYSIASVLASQAGSYDVVISSACAAPVTTNAATLTVQTPPEIDVPPANLTVCQGQQAQFSVIATGTNVGYQWRKGGQDIDGAIQSTYTIPSAIAAHAGNYDVVLTGTCGTPVTSPVAVLNVNTQPSISSFAPLSGNVGTQVVISGSGLTGAAGVTFNGTSATFTVDSDSQISATVPSGATSGPISVVKGGCTTATSGGGFTVVGGFGAPANLLATAISTTQIFVSWSAVSGVNHYELWRQNSGAGFTLLAQPVGNAYADSCGSGATCVYKVRAVDAVGTMSAFSNADLATTLFFTDDPLAAGMTVKAVHWTEARIGVNAVRAAAGLAPATFTDAALAGLAPKAVHLNELRAALDPARSAVGVPAIVYAETVSPGVPVRASHLAEIRSGVK